MLVLKTILHAVCLPGMIVVGVPWMIMSWWREQLAVQNYVGFVPITFGFTLMVWCMVEFVMRGRGTPIPLDPPKNLVERGPYRWSRNPMYVGILLMLFGEALIFSSSKLLLYAIGAWISFDCFIRLYEEPTLRARFGDLYQEYCGRVPRWLLRLPARSLKS